MRLSPIRSRLFWFSISGLFVNLVLLAGLARQPDWIEHQYSRGIYPILTSAVSRLSGLVPWSLTELTLALLLFLLPVTVLRHWGHRRRMATALGGWLAGGLWLLAWFYLAWGLNYFRQPLAHHLGLPAAPADTTVWIEAYELSVNAANQLSRTWRPLSHSDIDAEIEQGLRRIHPLVPIYTLTGQRRPKRLLFNIVLNKTLTTGFFSPVFHEVHLNADLLEIEYPFTLAHEKFHQLGFANEAEANFLAFLACVSSPEPLIQYSAYLAAVRYLGARLRIMVNDYDRYAAMIAPTVRQDFRRIRERWQKHAGRLSQFSRKTYDRYLKANNIREGMANYAGMADFLVGFWLPRMKDLHRGTSPSVR